MRIARPNPRVPSAADDARALFDALRRDTVTAWVAANPDRGERVVEYALAREERCGLIR